MSAANELTRAQRNDLRTVAAMIIPASDEYKVPGADDPAIQADMLATLGRDTALVAQALDHLARLAGQAAGRTRYGQARGDSERVPRHRRRRGSDARPRRPAMLLPRRPRAALARAGAARAVPEGLHAGGGRLVAARSGQGKVGDAQAGALAGQPCAGCGHLAACGSRPPSDEAEGISPCWILPQILPMTTCHRERPKPPRQTTRFCSTPIPTP